MNCFFHVYAVCGEPATVTTNATTPDMQCVTNEVSGNQNIQNCATMFAEQTSGNFDVQAFCGLSCIEDFIGSYDTCGFSPNPVEARELYCCIIYRAYN